MVQMYDGNGRHYGGVYPPLVEDNVLTPAYHQNKAARPACRDFCLAPDNYRKEIGLVWMLPLDMSLAVLIPHEIAGALARSVDAGQTVVVHDATDEACCGVLNLVRMFAGGGRLKPTMSLVVLDGAADQYHV